MMFCCCVADEKVENSIALPPVIPEHDQQDLQANEKTFVKTLVSQSLTVEDEGRPISLLFSPAAPVP